MTGTSAVLTPVATPTSNAGKTPAARKGMDTASADEGNPQAGFDALFARLTKGEGGTDGTREIASAGSGDRKVRSFTNIAAMRRPEANVALLASMRLNEALAPASSAESNEVGLETPKAPVGPEWTEEAEEPQSASAEQSEPPQELPAEDTAQNALLPLALWGWPQRQPVMQSLADGEKQFTTDRAPPDAPKVVGDVAVSKIESAAQALTSADQRSARVSATAGTVGHAAAPVAAVTVAAVRSAGLTSIAGGEFRQAGQMGEGPGTPGAVDENNADPDALVASHIKASPKSELASRPQRAPVVASARTATQPNPPQSATPAPASPAPLPVTDDAAAQPFASNLATEASASHGDRPASNKLATLASARVTAIHQEMYFAPTAQRSPVEQVVDRITDELAAAPRPEPAPTAESQRDSTSSTVKVLRLQLNPPDLGPLTVRMTLKREVLDLQMEAGQQETARLIDSDRDRLSSLLRAAGYTVDTVSVQTASRGDASAMNAGSGAFSQSSGGWQQSRERAPDGQTWQDDGGGDMLGGNGKDGTDRDTTRTVGGAVYL